MPPSKPSPPPASFLHFESRTHKVVTRWTFAMRLAQAALLWLAIAVVGLAIGMAGYAYFEGMSLADSYVNAAMILSGMGPFSPIHSTAAKLFAGCYAIYCGIALIATTGVILAPVIHRSLHKFHLEWDGDK